MQLHSIEVARASQAYGLRLTHPASPTKSAAPASPTTRAPDRLIAASVKQPVTFDSYTPTDSTPKAVLQLYTRAADKLEVAMAVQLGRNIDRTG